MMRWLIRGKGTQRSQALWAYVFLLLSVLRLLVFWILPIVAAFTMGFVERKEVMCNGLSS